MAPYRPAPPQTACTAPTLIRALHEGVRNGTGTVVAMNVECRTLLPQFELCLLCGGNKRGAIFGDKFDSRPASYVRIAPERDDVHARTAQRACSLAYLIRN